MEVEDLIEEIEDEFIVWNYKQLNILGLAGDCKNGLEHLLKACSDCPMEFSPIINEDEGEFLEGFNFAPPVGISIIKHKNIQMSIVAYSFDKEKAKEFVRDIVKRAGINSVASSHEQELVDAMNYEINVEKVIYNLCEQMSNLKNTPLEAVFGAVRYGNFLKHNGFSANECYRLAQQKFGLVD